MSTRVYLGKSTIAKIVAYFLNTLTYQFTLASIWRGICTNAIAMDLWLFPKSFCRKVWLYICFSVSYLTKFCLVALQTHGCYVISVASVSLCNLFNSTESTLEGRQNCGYLFVSEGCFRVRWVGWLPNKCSCGGEWGRQQWLPSDNNCCTFWFK